MADLAKFANEGQSEYERQIARVQKKTGFTSAIEETVRKATESVENGTRSFVIYGEPQSGKTEMMICLTAKLLDDGFSNIVILVNDNVDLQKQNLGRFRKSGISPAPKGLQDIKNSEALKPSIKTVIFCKKNVHDLEVLNDRLRKLKKRVVIDDEADFATPNAKVNSPEASKINEMVGKLLDADSESIYIGVTATPARLDLNRTFDNDSTSWVYFRPYPDYSGPEVFFPKDDQDAVEFRLITLPDEHDRPEFLREALMRFIINVAHLNIYEAGEEKNYCMLVHTSGLKEEHAADKVIVEKFFSEIEDPENKNFNKRYEEMEKIAEKIYSTEPLEIVRYIHSNRQRYAIKLINSEVDKSIDNITGATDPETPFTVAIGGNIISRGVTFNNLLTLFFSRTTKNKIQQDTYIQRARMFGNRKGYLSHFELHIPVTLYVDWHRAFTLHRLSMASIESGDPVWLEDRQVKAVAGSAIDRRTLSIDKGEISFALFKLNREVIKLSEFSKAGYQHFKELVRMLPKDYFGGHILGFVEGTVPSGESSVVVHVTRTLSGDTKGIDEADISRIRGMFGGADYEASTFPNAVHHFKIFANSKGRARVIYNYKSDEKSIRFLKQGRRRK